MPTNPVPGFLPDYSTVPEIKKRLDTLSGLTREMCNFGTHVLINGLGKDASGIEALPPLLLYRHILELLDSVSILVAQGSAEPCKLLLRAMLEARLQLEYMLKDKPAERALAWIVCRQHQVIDSHKRLDSSTKSGMEKLATMDQAIADLIRNQQCKQSQDDWVRRKENLFKRPPYKASEQEYQRLKASRRDNRPPVWYAFQGGPSTVFDLAKVLEQGEYYEILYRQWSDLAHANDITKGKLTRSDKGYAQIVQLRSLENVQLAASLAITFTLEATQLLVPQLSPRTKRALADWFPSEMEHPFSKILNREMFKVK